ncbi:oligosaccharide repeat unit polymerase [Guptibacillus hwajinpoensis]|uniref:oligosaccharide repeat unit polymerase n=1 Tax=Guptibacillus hwajinpoensis TaxID=208199 RepID=UPI001CFE516C|nr:oligosaccharide repeat unit polymerase [Pseudalkalibacillus hwajinpoensis]WLR61561.1 oligosaccharide repeat unit polymerase [Pseudalkalibacillus hwajinpoensis]
MLFDTNKIGKFKFSLLIIFLMILINYLSFSYTSINFLRSTYSGIIIIGIILFMFLFIFSNGLVKSIKHPLKLYLLFYSGYYLSGIINISDYRGYINETFWFFQVIIGLVAILIGWSIGKYKMKNNSYSRAEYDLNKPLIFIILGASFLCAGYVVFNQGLLFLNPDSRFSINPIASYMVELSIPVTIVCLGYMLQFNRKTSHKILLIIFTLVLLFCLGYRNQPMILLASVLLLLLFSSNDRHPSKKMRLIISTSFTVLLVIFSILFLMRNESSDSLFNWEKLASNYNVASPQLTIPIIPFHFQSREGMGVTEIALERSEKIEELTPINRLFILDLYTLLPGEQDTAGSIVGLVVNLSSNVSLTPSILGGLYISYGPIGIFIFYLIVGMILSILWKNYKRSNSFFHLALVTLFLIYLIELTNRGFFKPMYIISIIPLLIIVKKREK